MLASMLVNNHQVKKEKRVTKSWVRNLKGWKRG